MSDEIKTSYPSDKPYYLSHSHSMKAADDSSEIRADAGTYLAKDEESSRGKGRRGGNAASSRVIHSGAKKEEPRHPKARKSFGKKDYRTEAEGGSRFPGIDPGQAYELKVEKVTQAGAFVTLPEELLDGSFSESSTKSVLIPFAEQLFELSKGDIVSVRFYEDKGGRLTATMRTPILKPGEIGRLFVSAVTKIGAFLANGMPKEILLPFREQTGAVREGDEVLVRLYTDKSGREAASMRIYSYLSTKSPYHEGDEVRGFVYEVNPKIGIFVAVDDRYYGLVPIHEVYKKYEYGDELEARVARVRPDGKLDLLVRGMLYKTVREDAEAILSEIRCRGGFLPYADHADAAFIEKTFHMSKNQFKRALGHLYRQRIVELDRKADTVTLLTD